MRHTTETIYILLSKCLQTEIASVEGVYDSYDLASEAMEELMTIFEESVAYKIESRVLITE